MMKKSFSLELQKYPLKNVLVTTCGTSNISNTENRTELSNYVWELKDAHIIIIITFILIQEKGFTESLLN